MKNKIFDFFLPIILVFLVCMNFYISVFVSNYGIDLLNSMALKLFGKEYFSNLYKFNKDVSICLHLLIAGWSLVVIIFYSYFCYWWYSRYQGVRFFYAIFIAFIIYFSTLSLLGGFSLAGFLLHFSAFWFMYGEIVILYYIGNKHLTYKNLKGNIVDFLSDFSLPIILVFLVCVNFYISVFVSDYGIDLLNSMALKWFDEKRFYEYTVGATISVILCSFIFVVFYSLCCYWWYRKYQGAKYLLIIFAVFVVYFFCFILHFSSYRLLSFLMHFTNFCLMYIEIILLYRIKNKYKARE